MKISARIDRPLYGPSGGRRYLWLRLEAPRRKTLTERSPLDIALVLDRSGSMGGEKIALARRAAKGVTQVLRETDRCALVSYDDVVEVAAPCGAVDATHRGRIDSALDAIDARGSTDLFGGWVAGAEQISFVEAGRIRRVLLLTDGLANAGTTDPEAITQHVRELNLRGVGTTAFGIGRDFDEFLLNGMAEAGGGHFYFIERPEQIPDYLASELGELASVICRDVRVGVQVSGAATISCLNDIPTADGRYTLGDLSEAAVVDLLFGLEIAPGNSGPLALNVSVSWTDAETGTAEHASATPAIGAGTDAEAADSKPDGETIRNVVRTRSARVRHHSLSSNSKGEYAEARSAVQAEIAELQKLAADDPEAAAEAANLGRFADEVSMDMDPMARKMAHMMSYNTRRSRPDIND